MDRHQPRSWWPSTALAMAGVIVLAACGSSSSSSASNTQSSSAPSTTAGGAPPQTTAVNTAGKAGADEEAVKKVVLEASDYPSGWTTKEHDASSDNKSDKGSAMLAACLGVADHTPDRLAKVDGVDASMGTVQATSSASIYKTQAEVDQDVEGFKSPKLQGCLQQFIDDSLKSGLPAGSTVSDVKIGAKPGPAEGRPNQVMELTFSAMVAAGGQNLAVTSTAYFLRGPRIEAQFSLTSLGGSVPTDLGTPLVNAMAAKVAAS